MSIRSYAQLMGISEKYLEEVVGALRRAGIVRGFRGRGGGYRLAKPACSVTMNAIVSALDGPIVFAHCQDPAASVPCPLEGQCTA